MTTPNFICFVAAWLLVPALLARGDTRQSREEVTLMQIALAIGASEAATGTTPTNWAQLGRILNIEVEQQRSLLKSPAFPLQKHYIFVPLGLRMPEAWQAGEVKMLTAMSVQRDHRGLGRYAIHGASNSYHRTWISEEAVQTMLRSSGLTLPQPDPALVTEVEATAIRVKAEHAQFEHLLGDEAGALKLLPELLRAQIRHWCKHPEDFRLSPFLLVLLLLGTGLVAALIRYCYLVWKSRRGRNL